MSRSHVPDSVKCLLWGKAAGRCQYSGCNTPLGRDQVTGHVYNIAYVAHIVGDSADGPRGDAARSAELSASINNLMLLCDVHHRLVDVKDTSGHPESRLLEMKAEHEQRIELVTAIRPDRRTTVVTYGATTGDVSAPLTVEAAKLAVLPLRYPTDHVALGVAGSEERDHEESYWDTEARNLRRQFELRLRPRLADKSADHLSLFAFAPQPLLVLLGSLLTDIPETDVYQLHREPRTWAWVAHESPVVPRLIAPTSGAGAAALVLSLSANVSRERVTRVLGDDARVWELTIENPGNDFLRSREQLAALRSALRDAYNRIKSSVGDGHPLHVFPAAPLSVAIELGRVRQPKADLRLIVYDARDGVFTRALQVG